jgi:hypothetical protein
MYGSHNSRRVGLATATFSLAALLAVLSWNQFRGADDEDRHIALNAARSIATRIDMQFGGIEKLLDELSGAVSTDPIDIDANDALLRRVKSEQSRAIANIFLLTLDGRNIGNAEGQHAGAGDRAYFQRALASGSLVAGDPIRSRSNLGWVIPVARPVKDRSGEMRGVLVVAIYLEDFREMLGPNEFPADWVVRVFTENATEVTSVSNVSATTGWDSNRTGNVARQLRIREGSEVVNIDGNMSRVVAFSRARSVSWMVAVGLPPEAGPVRIAKGL